MAGHPGSPAALLLKQEVGSAGAGHCPAAACGLDNSMSTRWRRNKQPEISISTPILLLFCTICYSGRRSLHGRSSLSPSCNTITIYANIV